MLSCLCSQALGSRQHKRLEPKVAEALDNGWNFHGRIKHPAANPGAVRSPAAVLAARLDDLPPAGTTAGTRR